MPSSTATQTPTPSTDPVTGYAQDVIDKKIIVGRPVRLACERHMRDLVDGPARGLVWRADLARYAIEFFGYLRHSKGEWAGMVMELAPWQQFCVGSVFGWLRNDGFRRFRVVYEEIARKNGKSVKLAGVGVYALVADREPGGEVYAVAPLALSTEIPTSRGWTTMEDIKVGDVVFDDQGERCNVTYVSPVVTNHQCWELEFGNGEKVVCDEQHRWLCDATMRRGPPTGSRSMPKLRRDRTKAVFTLHNRRHHVCRWDDPEREQKFHAAVEAILEVEPLVQGRLGVRTTQAIVRDLHSGTRPNFRVPIGRVLNYSGGDALPIPPYSLGVWLGDGRSNRGSIVGHPSDNQIVDEVESEGFVISDHGLQATDGLRHYTPLGLRTRLRQCGLLDNKHIPDVYLRASYADRLALFQGLMDTDGTATITGECRFTNRNWALTKGIQELARSLGLKTNIRTYEVTGKPHYSVSFKVSAYDLPAFRLTRKRIRQVAKTSEVTRWLQIVAARQVASEPVRCISVDSTSHLYLATRSLIATHNTKKDQARIIFTEAQRMVRSSPPLRALVGVYKLNMSVDETASKFEPLSADEKTLDGLNPSCVLVDELHKHKSRALLDVMDSALGARRQPLLWMITTAGDDNTETIYATENKHALDVLEGVVEDDATFAYVATIDATDRWDDPQVWVKANPNLGISVKMDDLQRMASKAKSSPPALAAFKRLRLNVRQSAADNGIDMEVWARNSRGPFDPAALHGRKFYAGLDLSSKIDLTAWVKLFPPVGDDERWLVVPRFWMPADTVAEKSDRDQVQYQRWIDEGLIEATLGNVIDHNEVADAVMEDCRLHEAISIAFDPWNAAQLSANLVNQGAPMVEFIQGVRSYNAPTKELEAMLLSNQLDHGGNQVLAWMAHNMRITRPDRNENAMPSKKHSTGRIDGITALIMAIGRSMNEDLIDPNLDGFLSAPLSF